MRRAIPGTFVAALALAGLVSTAHAESVRPTRELPLPSGLLAERPALFPRPSPPAAPPRHRHPGKPHRHAHHVIVVPSAVFVTAARRECWSPGYWTHQWVPPTATGYTWIPGHWTADGQWIAAHYAPQGWSPGYWEPLWVPDAWGC
jgi:hypothetical protein